MTKMTEYTNGHFCWVDLMSRDLATAKGFYCDLFGWEVDDQGTDGPPYALFKLDGQNVAGLGEMTDEMKSSGMPPVWSSYVNVDDVDAACKRAGELGGTVVMPVMQVMDAGRMAIIQDPTGAFVSLWEKGNHYGAEWVNHPNSWGWNELLTRDLEKAKQFYTDLFGWTFEVGETPNGDYWTITNNGRMNGGMMAITPEMGEIPAFWGVYFSVENIDSAVQQVEKTGSILRPPFEVPVGKIAIVADGQGAMFNIIEMSVPVD